MEDRERQKVPKRILSSLINSISAGVVPRTGAPYMAIGRNDEITALLSDLETVNDGGSSMRFIIGKYGSGKSFLMQLIRGYALEQGFLTADADLSPERRICGAKGTGIATYRELIKNLSSKVMPEGGALTQVISRWLTSLQTEAASSGLTPDSQEFEQYINSKIYGIMNEIEGHIGGFDFATVVTTYRKACAAGNDDVKSACIRWLRGEYQTKTEAKQLLKVGSIIDDDNWYDFIKLFGVFAAKTGSRGLIVFIDECVNLYKISNRISRENNYEKLLSMFNDTLQGRAAYLGLILGGTPQFLEDTRRGLFSYEALRSRLSDGKFNTGEYKNMIGPVIRLRRLSDDEMFALIARITKLHSQYYNWEPRIDTSQMTDFLNICLSRAGADTLITPREMIRDYISVLNILYQNPDSDYNGIVGSGAVTLKHEINDEDNPAVKDEPSESAFDPEDIEF